MILYAGLSSLTFCIGHFNAAHFLTEVVLRDIFKHDISATFFVVCSIEYMYVLEWVFKGVPGF